MTRWVYDTFVGIPTDEKNGYAPRCDCYSYRKHSYKKNYLIGISIPDAWESSPTGGF